MKEYDILLMHGPVQFTEYIGDDTVVYTLEDGRKFTIKFSIANKEGRKVYFRDITDDDGNRVLDDSEFDIFNEGLSTEDYAQWTADNFSEIEEIFY